MTPSPMELHCARYNSCEAAFCPLDRESGSHIAGEKVCWWLRATHHGHVAPDPVLAAACTGVLAEIKRRGPYEHPRLHACATGDIVRRLKATGDPVAHAEVCKQRLAAGRARKATQP
jgi:hypothetical protein